MKVIDLLNKKENGEKVPLIIKYNDEKYYFNGANYFTKPAGFCGHVLNIKFSNLNDEIEIIEPLEEDKKIRKIEIRDQSINIDKINDDGVTTTFFRKDIEIFQLLSNKINELIDEINKLKENK